MISSTVTPFYDSSCATGLGGAGVVRKLLGDGAGAVADGDQGLVHERGRTSHSPSPQMGSNVYYRLSVSNRRADGDQRRDRGQRCRSDTAQSSRQAQRECGDGRAGTPDGWMMITTTGTGGR